MNKKGILLFDIDRTIFDTDRMNSVIDENVLRVLDTTDLEKVKKTNDIYKKTLSDSRKYVPDDYLKLLCKRFKFEDLGSLLDIYYAKEFAYIYEESVFPETLEIFEKLIPFFRIGVFSEGTEKFQNNKFKSMNLDKYISKDLVFIFDNKNNDTVLSKIPKEAIVVDDKESVCDYLTDNEIEAIWLNKKDDRVSDKFKTIHHLTELPSMLL